MRRSRLFLLNSGSILITRIGGNLLSLLTLPLFISYFGDSRYGVFILAVSATQSLGIFDLGVKSSLVRYTAEFLVDKDDRRYTTVFSGSVIIAGVIGSLIALTVFLLSYWAPSIFDVSAENANEAVQVFQVAAIYTLVFVLGRTAQGILEGHQLFYWNSINQLPVLAVTVAIYIVVKSWGISLVTFASVMMAGSLLPVVLNIVVIVRKSLLEGISFRPGLNKDLLKSEFIQYSGNLFALQLISFFAFQVDRFVIGGILSAAMVTTYIVVTKPMFIIRMVSNQMLSVLSPILAEFGRSGDDKRFNNLIRRGNLALSVLLFPLAALTLIFIRDFVDLWIGGVHSAYAHWGGIASLAFIFMPFYGIAIKALTYTGKAVIVRKVSFWTVLVNVVISVASTFFIGIGGVIVGSLIQAAIQVPIYAQIMKDHRGTTFSDMIPLSLWVNGIFVIVVGLAIYAVLREHTLDNWWKFSTALVLSIGVLYSFGAWIIVKHQLFFQRVT